ncbi:fimbrial protein [Hafnia paralvei]|jgi:type 1 fimbria pilin|uniref:fimbrial protein n=1 Tax=Hafnia paralvei TaxID=546367 RepID=UPI0015858AE4|nr:fimbrial protein [Hafnia paralvei]MCE9909906.1 type 1 fimbrial protein [Hafnia paralvei]NUN41627.1 type 1 fimbrial protein [Hafnia paralvei]
MWLRMKKPVALAVGVFLASTALAHAASTENYDISFSGQLDASPCHVDAPATIDLGEVMDSRIGAVSTSSKSPSSAVSWSVNFTDCPLDQQIQAVINGTAYQGNPVELVNQSTDNPAEGVGIAFWQRGQNILTPNKTPYTTIKAEDGTAMMLFTVGMVREDSSQAPKAGNVSTSGQLLITYL